MRIGIDLGGTKIEILSLNEQGEVVYRERCSTPQGDYQQTLLCIKQLIETVENKLALTGTIGICTPGSISPNTGLLRNSNSTCLNNQPFKQDLESILHRKIRIANDANCFALSEATDGSAQYANIVFGVIIGTGCGAGIVINKHLIDGPNAISGEWGHNPLPYPENGELDLTRCWCGQRGCIETFLSGPGLALDYQRLTGTSKTGEQIIELSNENDIAASLCFTRYQHRMARSLAHVINILDPHVIVLGGGLSNIDSLYTNIPKLWQQYVFSDTVNTQLLAPTYGDSSGVRGAAWLWN